MTQITYDIIHRGGGWCVACGDQIGPPYYRKGEVIADVMFIARALINAGKDVRVSVEGVETFPEPAAPNDNPTAAPPSVARN